MSVQRYVSRELTHFVGRGLKDHNPDRQECQERQYDLLIKILRQGELGKIHTGPGWTITHSKHAAMPLSTNVKYGGLRVCFCDIPVEDLGIHMQKYSEFGLAFSKGFLAAKGASPVYYVSQESIFADYAPSPITLSGGPTFITMKEMFDRYSKELDRLLITFLPKPGPLTPTRS